MAVITLIYGFMMYLPQKDMKRLLAWSTITQLLISSSRYLSQSLDLVKPLMWCAYIFNHAFAKSLFFLVAGALSYSCGTRMLPRLKGLINKYPLLVWLLCCCVSDCRCTTTQWFL
ncbi:hydrogenase 4 subunit D [Proteus mirabilis]|uniref:Hydrogenase 4 subunit D n=1 Tax=Proteus mirabilis TaxID=584 RepID=A0A379GC04_PROMI|nr:hydrogenase 4 subunit D [Proteus mirabilis]